VPTTKIARELETSRYELYLWLHKTERAWRSYKVARQLGALSLIEDAMGITDGPTKEDGTYDAEADTKIRVQRDHIRSQFKKYIASVDDPDTFGKKEQKQEIKLTLPELHLDALRAVSVALEREQQIMNYANTQKLPSGFQKKETLVTDAELISETEVTP
jgi:hypothetical protein